MAFLQKKDFQIPGRSVELTQKNQEDFILLGQKAMNRK
jgi:hypothetical protein